MCLSKDMGVHVAYNWNNLNQCKSYIDDNLLMVSGQFALIIKLPSLLRIKYFLYILGQSIVNAMQCDSIKALDLLIHSKINQFIWHVCKRNSIKFIQIGKFPASKGFLCNQKKSRWVKSTFLLWITIKSALKSNN